MRCRADGTRATASTPTFNLALLCSGKSGVTLKEYNDVIHMGTQVRPPCEYIVRFALPAFRSLVARELIDKYSFSQVEAARKLGTTQAAISQYLSSKRGGKQLERFAALQQVKTAADEIAYGIATSKVETMDAITMFCKLCVLLRNTEEFCEDHREQANLPADCGICKK